MTRGIGGTNESHVDGSHVTEVLLVLFDYDTPRYVHTGYGSITWDGNVYLGLGTLADVDTVKESDSLKPNKVTFTLNGLDADWIAEALAAGRYGDRITVYAGYRNAGGALIADPWIVFAGTHENANIQLGALNSIKVTARNDLARLSEINGRKYTNEEQQRLFAGDTGLSFVADVIDKELIWRGGPISNWDNTNNQESRDERESGAHPDE